MFFDLISTLSAARCSRRLRHSSDSDSETSNDGFSLGLCYALRFNVDDGRRRIGVPLLFYNSSTLSVPISAIIFD